MTGLTNGTRYYFRVLAHNAAGNSASSNVVNAIPRTVPSAPRTLTGDADQRLGPGPTGLARPGLERRLGDHRLHHPTLDRTARPAGRRSTTACARRRLHGHRSDQRHPLLLPGAGQERRRQRAVEQRRQPDPPHGAVSAADGDGDARHGRVVLTWTPPASTGGAPITRYVIQRSTSPTTGWVDLNTTSRRRRDRSRPPACATAPATTSASPPSTPPEPDHGAQPSTPHGRSDREPLFGHW